MKPKALFVFALFFLPLFLTACSVSSTLSSLPIVGKFFNSKNDGGVGSSPVTITYWGLFEGSDIYDPINSLYVENNPNITIAYEKKDFDSLLEYKDIVLTRLAQGTAPDVITVHVSWLPEIYKYLLPASPAVFNSEEFKSQFYPSAAKACVIDGSVYCAPPSYDGLVLLYNKDLFRVSGITTPPKDWEDFRQLAVDLTKKDANGKIQISGAAIGSFANVAFASDILGLMFSQSNVSIPDDFNTIAAADALSFYVGFVKTDKVWDKDMPYSSIAFSQGKVGMMFGTSWMIWDIYKSNTALKDSIGVAPVPQVPVLEGEGLTNSNWASYWVLAVPKNSSQQTIAWDFIKYMVSSDTQLYRYSTQSQYRPFGQAYSLVDLEQSLLSNDFLSPVTLGAKTAVTSVIADRSGNDIYVEVLYKAIDSVLSGGSSSSALLNAKSAMQTLSK